MSPLDAALARLRARARRCAIAEPQPQLPPQVPTMLCKLQDRAAMHLQSHLHEGAVLFPWWADGEDRWHRACLVMLLGENAARLEVRDARSAEFVCRSTLADWFTVDPAHWSIDNIGEDEFDRYAAGVATSASADRAAHGVDAQGRDAYMRYVESQLSAGRAGPVGA